MITRHIRGLVKMTVYDEKTDFKFNKSAVTLGKFDGLHLGHQELIVEVVN